MGAGFARVNRNRWLTVKLTWKRITAHTRHPFKIARAGSSASGDGTRIERIVVAIEHQGVVGFGEAAPTPYYHQSLDTVDATLAAARPMLAAMSPDIDAVVDAMLERFGDQRATVAAIDAAVFDLLGKQSGSPVWKMLDLDAGATAPTSFTIGIDSPERLAQKVAEANRFRCLKIKVGTDGDLHTLSTLRSLAPDTVIRVDANCGWPADALDEHIAAIAPFGVELIEQPTVAGELDKVAAARTVSPVPIMADEDSVTPEDVPRLAGVYDGINVKLSKCGGIREALRMIRLARDLGLKVMIGCMLETSLGVAAAAHIASLCDYVDLDGHLLLADDPYRGLTFRDGVVLPTNAPGLGVALA